MRYSYYDRKAAKVHICERHEVLQDFLQDLSCFIWVSNFIDS